MHPKRLLDTFFFTSNMNHEPIVALTKDFKTLYMDYTYIIHFLTIFNLSDSINDYIFFKNFFCVCFSECGDACNQRCSATSHKKPCLFYCNKCCEWCQCVPPGTSGGKECCDCYNNWKTKRGGPKCP